ncbi:Late embryogenesis abundant (LEA) hydroxyproline-rich glycoprotein family [Striga hermonthica]|uniref:Late embryogenesis abundant (LEA) hydroxyproline-rich glycoprotein family n=1 Tax=Striga hermonthica TaxID=68872 RepID=A0A9N7RTJ5_STRHE|nr:Late embryogenesis abundant (LEA) hydroxyproline-rich glycoprotein family [Striga hermonthica]
MADPLPPPPPATHTVQLPHDEQIPRYPPEIAKRMAALTRIQERATTMEAEALIARGRRRFFCLFTLSLVSLVAVAASAAAAMYLVFDFKSPEYTVLALAIRGLDNLTSSSAPISPEITVTIRAENPNGRVDIYYLNHGAAGVSCGGVQLSSGRMTAFYQPRRSVAVVRVMLAGSGVELGGGAAFLTALRSAERRQRVPLVVKVEAPIVFEVGSAKTWKMVIRLRCLVVVDALAEKAEIFDKKCGHTVRLW